MKKVYQTLVATLAAGALVFAGSLSASATDLDTAVEPTDVVSTATLEEATPVVPPAPAAPPAVEEAPAAPALPPVVEQPADPPVVDPPVVDQPVVEALKPPTENSPESTEGDKEPVATPAQQSPALQQKSDEEEEEEVVDPPVVASVSNLVATSPGFFEVSVSFDYIGGADPLVVFVSGEQVKTIPAGTSGSFSETFITHMLPYAVVEVFSADTLLASKQLDMPTPTYEESQTANISNVVVTPVSGGARLTFDYDLNPKHKFGYLVIIVDDNLYRDTLVDVFGPGSYDHVISLKPGEHSIYIDTTRSTGDSSIFAQLFSTRFVVEGETPPGKVEVTPLPITKPEGSNVVTVPTPGEGYHYTTNHGDKLVPGTITLQPGQQFCGRAVLDSDALVFAKGVKTEWCFSGVGVPPTTPPTGNGGETPAVVDPPSKGGVVQPVVDKKDTGLKSNNDDVLAYTGSDASTSLVAAIALLLAGLGTTVMVRRRKVGA